MHHATFVLLTAFLLGAGPPKGDLKKVQGAWQPTTIESDGANLENDELETMKVIIDGDKYTVTRNGAVIDRGTLQMHDRKKPKQLEDTSSMGEHKGQSMKAIYELTDDTWKVCLAEPGKPRPKHFAADAGSGHLLYIMKRVRKPSAVGAPPR